MQCVGSDELRISPGLVGHASFFAVICLWDTFGTTRFVQIARHRLPHLPGSAWFVTAAPPSASPFANTLVKANIIRRVPADYRWLQSMAIREVLYHADPD
jgi:hypothetical protein